ncbi:hypothetical protein ACIOUE_35615 [Streptomyces xanthochromogenes]|uniref:hypothetical protein n=1 Tax=Streptomyces xanthochromogenes TaxID=67384 RepID=UPI0037FFE77D
MTQTTIPIRAVLGRAVGGNGLDMAYVLVDQAPALPAWLSPGGEQRTALVSRALAAGLHLAMLGGTPIRQVPECWASYQRGIFSVASMRLGGTLVDATPLDAPAGWERAARKAGKIAVIVGDDIVNLGPRPGDTNFEFLTPAAKRGALAMGGVPFTD